MKLAWVSVVVLGVGCASSGAATGPGMTDDHVTLRTGPSQAWIVELTPDGLTGPTASLGFYGSGIRGSLEGRPIELDTTDTSVTGKGPGWTQLQVQSTPESLTFDGEFSGRPAHLALSDARIDAVINQCSFELTGVGGLYKGTSSCVSPWPIELQLPHGFSDLRPSVKAAVLAMVLDHSG